MKETLGFWKWWLGTPEQDEYWRSRGYGDDYGFVIPLMILLTCGLILIPAYLAYLHRNDPEWLKS